jgi:hypothetical protein
MERKIEFLLSLWRRFYLSEGICIDFRTLIDLLNAEGFLTESGHAYSTRSFKGLGRLLSCAYTRLTNAGRHEEAEGIALTFVNTKGGYAYE